MISIQNMGFSYKRKPVFKNLNLQLHEGFIYGLLGKNGSGKSTLLRNIVGLLYPDTGSIAVNGHNPMDRKPAFLSEIFMVPEVFSLPDISIKNYIATHSPFYPDFDAAALNNYLSEFEIPDHASLKKMSYGQQKKFLISFGLAARTHLLVLDEPTNGLDIISKSQFRKIMAAALTEQSCVIISTHQVKDLENLIDRITIIEDGSILFDQSISEIGRRLAFRAATNEEDIQTALYSEPALRGTAIVTRNLDPDEESRIDMELLYKTILRNPQATAEVFK